MIEITVSANDAGRRIDKFLRKFMPGAQLSAIYKMIRKDIKVNGKRVRENYVLGEGDFLVFYLGESDFKIYTEKDRDPGTSGVKRSFKIIYEDEKILVADKPFGLLTHGDRSEKKNHLANQVKDYLIETGAYDPRERVFSPAPANRLDRNTTGLVLFGKTSGALSALTEMIREGEIEKRYTTIAHGDLGREFAMMQESVLAGILVKDERTNTVRVLPKEDNVEKSPGSAAFEGTDGERRAGENEKHIVTRITPLAILGRNALGSLENYRATLLTVVLETGRTHQIRAHLSSAGYPIIGDSKYATRRYIKANEIYRKKFGLGTQILHSSSVTFTAEKGPLAYLAGKTIESELPESFETIISTLGEFK